MTTNSTSEREQRLRAELTRRLTIARGIEIESGSAKDRAFVDGGIAAFEALLDDLSLLDSEAPGKRDFEWALRELADGWIANNEREGPYGFNQNARRVLQFIANDARQEERRAVLKESVKVVEKLVCPPQFEGNWRNGYSHGQNDAFRALEAAANETKGEDGLEP